MRIEGPKGNVISTLEDWRGCVRAGHWKEGRSAHSLARYILQEGGADHLESRVSCVLSTPVTFDEAIPEYRARFDKYGGSPSNLDLAIWGRVGEGSGLFVGIEAKVDEPLSDTIRREYQSAIDKRRKGERTNKPERMEELLSRYFSDSDDPRHSKFADVRYQLLTATAGTVAVQRQVSVFYVIVFRTELYDPAKARKNHHDYLRFLDRAGASLLSSPAEGVSAHELTLAGRRLVSLYETVCLQSRSE